MSEIVFFRLYHLGLLEYLVFLFLKSVNCWMDPSLHLFLISAGAEQQPLDVNICVSTEINLGLRAEITLQPPNNC